MKVSTSLFIQIHDHKQRVQIAGHGNAGDVVCMKQGLTVEYYKENRYTT